MPSLREEDLERSFTAEYQQLRKVADYHLDARLRQRVSPSDVVQDAWVEATQRLESREDRSEVPIGFWLRFLVKQCVQKLRRFHLRTRKRSVSFECPLNRDSSDTSSQLVDILSASVASPSSVLIRSETRHQVQAMISQLTPGDQEILILRHVENMTNQECADRLGITGTAASKRYNRALERLQEMISCTSLC
ncbi:MAG: sigma-70 family RNA polymerase sigma factor [Planctomyces sp.]|jgi:RNA polymerase sigma-70 factor (ECF subfamily)